MDLSVILDNLPRFASGAWVTVQLTALSVLIGLVLAVPVALARLSANPLLSWPAYAYMFYFRGTPLLVQIFLIYYGSGQFVPELRAVGLGARVTHYPGELSGGEQQRVALARALAPEPALLIADEPTGNLDADTGAQIADLLFSEQKRRAMTMVLVTHDKTLAARCGREVAVRSGEIERGGAPVRPAVAVAEAAR